MENVDLDTVNKNLLSLIETVESMKEEMEDMFLTAKEEENMKIAEKELEEGKTTSLEDIKKELKI